MPAFMCHHKKINFLLKEIARCFDNFNSNVERYLFIRYIYLSKNLETIIDENSRQIDSKFPTRNVVWFV